MELPTLLAPPDWTRSAACLTADPLEFDQATDTARAICAQCPVRLTCAITALTNAEPHGIYGGLTPTDRRALAPTYGYDTPGMPPHGSRARYVHRTQPCRPDRTGQPCPADLSCREAHRRWAAERRAAGAWTRRADTPDPQPRVMTDGIRTGWDITGDILGLLIGLLPVIVLTAALVVAAREIPHRVRVHQIRRHMKRSGRTTRSS